MKWSTAMRGRIIVMTVAVGMLVITQPAATPGIKVQKNTVEIVTRCGSSSGHDFYLQGGLVSPDRAGWSKGRISSGQILLIHNGNEPDIIFTDATKQIQSARAEGATVIEVEGGPPGFRLILAVYQGNGTIEHFLFGLDEDGSGTVAWGTSRANALITKSSLYKATCQAP